MFRLLILACSATKCPDVDAMPAIARYDGPLWRTLRAADPEGRRARVAFLSAQYGFRDATTPIADYDARLTRDLAERMIAGGVTTRWPRPPSPRRPDTHGIHAGAEIAGPTRYGAEPFAEIALVGGRLYLAVMQAFVRGFVDMGCVRGDARIHVINGPIGRMRQDLRSWLCAADGAGGVRS
ncbi:hypothetical protein PUR23_28115 [Methylorubrum populi]|jgi:hypothetical protein|uniref:Uncharacterized protein n=1 Tax=Methylorubrum extorquens (strain DSM 6343 / CIP 106787 / DM4) TaxID=661410 RepID=C7CN53_METED|nr:MULTISPECIES: hypothetical protein [Methylorubrum]MDV2986895.1 hypothetical protein [Methylobacteriaceae bacterium AG10]PZP65778.1 MAG: hypothetical protein DI590_26190 [Methylorubrum populi]CAX17083.1 protein of unknown function [Methylorubrum extorquens DM4]